jgi:hypothetical protein
LTALQHPKADGLSDRQIAEHCGVACQTVCNYRKSMTVQNGQSSRPRKGRDGRTINTVNAPSWSGEGESQSTGTRRDSTPAAKERLAQIWANLFLLAHTTAELAKIAGIGASNRRPVDGPGSY